MAATTTLDGVHVHLPDFTRIATGLAGAEGPVVDGKARVFMVAPEKEVEGASAGEILQVDPASGAVRVHCAPRFSGVGGIPAGCQVDREARLWVADMRHGVLLVEETGHAEQMFRACGMDAMHGCNDCAFDPHGRLWVTAPAGPIAPAPYRRSFEAPFGRVYCVYRSDRAEAEADRPRHAASSSAAEPHFAIAQVDTGLWFPNGIAVSADGAHLYVAETGTKTIWRYDITGCSLGNKQAWATVPGDHAGGPDGMDFDAEGNLLVCNWGAGFVEVLDQHGRLATRIKCPFERVSNLHFVPGKRTVLVTEHSEHGLWRFEWTCGGQPQYCETARQFEAM